MQLAVVRSKDLKRFNAVERDCLFTHLIDFIIQLTGSAVYKLVDLSAIPKKCASKLLIIFERMRILTLITDLGYRDPYLAIVKAGLLRGLPDVHLIELSCGIRQHHISDAAYVLKNTLADFPDKSIHLVGVKFLLDRHSTQRNSQVDNSRFLVTKFKNQYIISPDNGLFSLLDSAFSEPVYQLPYNSGDRHFYLRDVMVPAAIQLWEGKGPEEIGAPTTDYYKAYHFESFLNGNVLRGKAIYVDDFGNIVTNITRNIFEQAAGQRNYEVILPGKRITRIHE